MTATRDEMLLHDAASLVLRAKAWRSPRIKDQDRAVGEALKLCKDARLIIERVEIGLCRESAIREELQETAP